MTAVPAVANGQLIDPAAWGNPVTNILNQRAENISFVPGGNLDTIAGAGTAVWITVGNLTVPAWAAKCILNYAICNIVVGAGFTSVEDLSIQAKIGTDAGRSYILNATVGAQYPSGSMFSPNDLVTLTSSGVKSLTISVTKTGAGAGTERVNTRSHITATAIYLP